MSTTRKIEGYYDPTQGTKYDEEVRMDLDHADFVKGPNHVPATLIIGGKGYTEEEVKAILKDVITAQSDPSQFVTRQHGSFLGDWIKAAVSKALATHGITLP